MRKVWNQPAWPVWSISTLDESGNGNLNVATYVTPVSLTPKLVTVAVYHNTKTHDNLQHQSQCLVQLLTEPLAPVVRVAGRVSGRSVDKIARLQKRFELEQTPEGFWYFPEAAGYMVLTITDQHEVGGDHTLCTGKVERSSNGSDEPLLTTEHLREHGYIR